MNPPPDPLGRHDPAAWTRTLAHRKREHLPFEASAIDGGTPIMLDTTVYIDALKAPGLPPAIAALLARNVVIHSAIARAEHALSLGHLDPAHPQTTHHRAPIRETLARMAPSRIFAPSKTAWTEAAIIAGILARIQGHARETRRALLNDALMLLTAIEQNAALISRNIKDMDLLHRFRPDATILLYDHAKTR